MFFVDHNDGDRAVRMVIVDDNDGSRGRRSVVNDYDGSRGRRSVVNDYDRSRSRRGRRRSRDDRRSGFHDHRGGGDYIALLRREEDVIKIAEKDVDTAGIGTVIDMASGYMGIVTGAAGQDTSRHCGS